MLYQIIFSFFDVESPPTRLYYEFRPTLYLRFNFLFFLFHHALFYLLIKPDALVRFGIFSLSLSLSLSPPFLRLLSIVGYRRSRVPIRVLFKHCAPIRIPNTRALPSRVCTQESRSTRTVNLRVISRADR